VPHVFTDRLLDFLERLVAGRRAAGDADNAEAKIQKCRANLRQTGLMPHGLIMTGGFRVTKIIFRRAVRGVQAVYGPPWCSVSARSQSQDQPPKKISIG